LGGERERREREENYNKKGACNLWKLENILNWKKKRKRKGRRKIKRGEREREREREREKVNKTYYIHTYISERENFKRRQGCMMNKESFCFPASII
jgi:hypothetical protein